MRVSKLLLTGHIRPTSAKALIEKIRPLTGEPEAIINAVLRAGEDEYGYPSLDLTLELEQ